MNSEETQYVAYPMRARTISEVGMRVMSNRVRSLRRTGRGRSPLSLDNHGMKESLIIRPPDPEAPCALIIFLLNNT
jgi:hypothetical protein